MRKRSGISTKRNSERVLTTRKRRGGWQETGPVDERPGSNT
uniref:Uncharacterized protein n=1 Tax=Raoultella ornithinolytica TaxID=54291 RepID=A0A2H4ZGK3_RAOOR|nr:Hypothetical protein [Raoultella ornithinolytica]